jgi:hypothetical protein
MSTIPTKLETLEDFEVTCDEFLVPFVENRAKRLADVIQVLHDKMATGRIEQDDVLLHMNEIEEITAWASENNPMAPYMENIIALEQKLIEEGLLNYTNGDATYE